MSWFPKTTAADESLREDESFEGVSVERRQLIRLSLGAFAVLTLPWPHAVLARAASRLPSDLTWDALLEQAVPMAESIVQSLAPNEEAYLLKLSGLVERLATVPDEVFEPGGVNAWFFHKFPFIVAQFRLAAGATIPYHDHRDYNGVLRIVEGEARIRSFEIIGANKRLPSSKTFLIRETKRELLGAGQLSTLSRTRDNIHDIRAGIDGARLLDFFTFFRKEGESIYLNVDERPSDPTQRIFEASWAV